MKKVFLILAAILLVLPGIAGGDFYTQVRPLDVATFADGYNSGVTGESGASIYVIDLTKYRQYQGDIMFQITGVSTGGLGPPADPATGISIYYASTLDADATDSGDTAWARADWKLLIWNHLIEGGASGYPIAIPSSVTIQATPYLGVKVMQDTSAHDDLTGTGGSPFALELRGAVR